MLVFKKFKKFWVNENPMKSSVFLMRLCTVGTYYKIILKNIFSICCPHSSCRSWQLFAILKTAIKNLKYSTPFQVVISRSKSWTCIEYDTSSVKQYHQHSREESDKFSVPILWILLFEHNYKLGERFKHLSHNCVNTARWGGGLSKCSTGSKNSGLLWENRLAETPWSLAVFSSLKPYEGHRISEYLFFSLYILVWETFLKLICLLSEVEVF